MPMIEYTGVYYSAPALGGPAPAHRSALSAARAVPESEVIFLTAGDQRTNEAIRSTSVQTLLRVLTLTRICMDPDSDPNFFPDSHHIQTRTGDRARSLRRGLRSAATPTCILLPLHRYSAISAASPTLLRAARPTADPRRTGQLSNAHVRC